VALGGAHSIPSAVNGQQLAVSFGADSCFSFGHSAWSLLGSGKLEEPELV
jgi:hypothetical protein